MQKPSDKEAVAVVGVVMDGLGWGVGMGMGALLSCNGQLGTLTMTVALTLPRKFACLKGR